MYHHDGYLEIILGTMFSGKTSYLLHKISVMTELNLKVLYININFDDRSNDNYSTHNPFLNSLDYKNKEKILQNLTMIKINNLMKINNELIENIDIVMIDESQFFSDLIEFTNILLEKKKNVFIASLIADFTGGKFGLALDLIPICDSVIKLNSYCSECVKNKQYNKAIYSKKNEDNFNKQNKIDIGGSDKYTAVCRFHNKN